MIIITLCLAILSSCLYRAGGLSKALTKRDIPWCPQFLINSKIRDVGCTLLTLLWLYLFFPIVWYGYLISGILMYGALTTYWDEAKYINWMYPEDSFYLHGFFIALALAPVLLKGNLLGFLLRCVILSIMMGVWCHVLPKSKTEKIKMFFSNDYSQELFRGFAIIISLLLLLI